MPLCQNCGANIVNIGDEDDPEWLHAEIIGNLIVTTFDNEGNDGCRDPKPGDA
jgi:hypothetical protein